jgi:putative two-component system response regulator
MSSNDMSSVEAGESPLFADGGVLDPGAFFDPRILIVDDEESNVRLLERILTRGGYRRLEAVTDPRLVPEILARYQPDLILLDLHMPRLDGFGVLELLGMLVPPGAYLPVLVLTADVTQDAKRKALAGRAHDFLTKPFDAEEVLLRIRNMLHTRWLHLQLQEQNDDLESRVRERTRDSEQAQIETFERLALAAEYRDDETGQHTRRVGRMTGLIAAELGLPADEVLLIERAAALHDLGKIGVPDAILLKPGRLEPDEFDVVKTHTEIGARILSGSHSPLLRMAEQIAGTHHERWDGGGYVGLAGLKIPLVSRITAVSDTFDAITNERPYKAARSAAEAVEEIRRVRGQQFDPDAVDAFLQVQERGVDLLAPTPAPAEGVAG